MHRVMLLAVALLLVVVGGAYAAPDGGYSNPNAVVTADQLRGMVGRNDVKIVDVRGTIRYHLGHIPGAVDVAIGDFDVKRDGEVMVFPDAQKFSEVMSKYGVRNEDTIVIYDEENGKDAARLYMMLLYFGHDASKVSILDGGYKAWKGDTDMMSPEITASQYKAEAKSKDFVLMMQDVKNAVGKEDVIFLDVREPKVFAEKGDKGGHIPGAVNYQWSDVVDKENKAFYPASELKKMYDARGIESGKKVIVYGEDAADAAYTVFVLTQLLGYDLDDVKLYDGTWEEWTKASSPVEK